MTYLELDELVATSDIVTLHLPLTDETRHVVNRRLLARMKPSAVLINTARGGLVDEAALVEALASGALLGAGLDVTEDEPVSPESPLLAMENVIVTPHYAAAVADNFPRVVRHAYRNVTSVLDGTPVSPGRCRLVARDVVGEDRIERLYVQAADAHEFVARVLSAEGLSARHAMTVAECLVRADLRGVDTHGIARLPGYVDRLRRGLVNPRPKLDVRRASVAAASIDGDDGFGFVVGRRAMDEAIGIAAEVGVGIVSARRSTHFGMAGAYALMGIEHGLVTLVVTNASPGLAPWGGRKPLVGTSPLAFAAPAGTSIPFVLDMSPTVVARGRSGRRPARQAHPQRVGARRHGERARNRPNRGARRGATPNRGAQGLRPVDHDGYPRWSPVRGRVRRQRGQPVP